jgi:predicted PurR-regulated permease PerM
MELADLFVVGIVAAVVVFPLAREYQDFRAVGFTRGAALSTTLLLLPALAVGIALALPLGAEPVAQWTMTVVSTVAFYSAATRAILARASSAATAPSRRT